MSWYLLFSLLWASSMTSQEVLDIMAYNIRYGTAEDGDNQWDIRKDYLAQMLQYYEPDFIGTQEGQKFQLDFIKTHLTPYEWFGAPRSHSGWPEYTAVFYRTDKFTLIEENTFWLSPTPDTMSIGWDAAIIRVATYGLVQMKDTDKYIWILNTHFDHIGPVARLESAKLIHRVADELIRQHDAPIVIMGDFNDTHNTPPIQYLKQYFNDSREVSENPAYGSPGTWNGFDFNAKPTEIIDYIFIGKNPQLRVLKYRIIDDFYDFKYPSDHLPVMIRVSLE